MKYEISHRTRYAYSQPVSISHHVLHVTPPLAAHQVCYRSALAITPTAAVSSPGIDCFGNPTTLVAVQEQHSELVIDARSIIEVNRGTVPAPGDTPPWDSVFGIVEADVSPDGLATRNTLSNRLMPMPTATSPPTPASRSCRTGRSWRRRST